MGETKSTHEMTNAQHILVWIPDGNDSFVGRKYRRKTILRCRGRIYCNYDLKAQVSINFRLNGGIPAVYYRTSYSGAW